MNKEKLTFKKDPQYGEIGYYDVFFNGENIGQAVRHDNVTPGYWGRWSAGSGSRAFTTDTREKVGQHLIERYTERTIAAIRDAGHTFATVHNKQHHDLDIFLDGQHIGMAKTEARAASKAKTHLKIAAERTANK